MKVYLVENYAPDMEFDKNSLIVALAPEVCYCLDKAGIRYSTIEDYYDPLEVALTEEYSKLVLQWIDRLDAFLYDRIKELKEFNLKLGAMYGFFLRDSALDQLFVRCYSLNKLLEATKPSSIVFVSYRPKHISLDTTFRSVGQSYYSQVTSIICRERNIPLASVFPEQSEEAKHKIDYSRNSPISRFARTLYERNATLRRTFFVYKYLSKHPLTRQQKQKKLNIFLLKTTHTGRDFIIDALQQGHNAYELCGDSIIRHTSLGPSQYLALKSNIVSVIDNSIWESTARLLEGHDLTTWFNEKYQIDVSEIVLQRLKHFVLKICPEVLEYYKVLTEFYKRAKIDFVLTPHDVLPVESAAIAAANHLDRIKTVCISHGDGVYNCRSWEVREIQNHDIVIASNIERKEYYARLSAEVDTPTELYSSPHRLLNVVRINRLRRKRKVNLRERIIYLPIFFHGDNRGLDGGEYPDIWYYRFQKSLIQFLSTRTESTFVWKGLPGADLLYNPIPNFIKDSGFANIEIATNPFTEHLLSADRVICDCPSTGFYEAVVAGVPTMSLYYKTLTLRKSAVDYFGNLLKLFSDIPEAIKHVDEFLNSDPELYKMTIDMGDEKVIDILEKVAKRNNS
jgi:hypothetical protein